MARDYEIVPPDGVPVVALPENLSTLPRPVYRTPSGKFRPIKGEWCFPREVYSTDGALFVEMPLPSYDGWGITYHAVQRRRTPLGTFHAQYVEGRASGFPWWPVVHFAASDALEHVRSWFRSGEADDG